MDANDRSNRRASASETERYLTSTTHSSRSTHIRFALACGVGLWLLCAAYDALVQARVDEEFMLRLSRRWSEHPLRIVAAGTLAIWAIGGLIRGPTGRASPSLERRPPPGDDARGG